MVIDEENGRVRVAIGCQGGGSHTAFTAGVLKRILKENNKKYKITALSGASGGGICALLAWYGLLTNDKDKAIRLLDSFWRDISVSSYWDMLLNDWIVWISRMHDIAPMHEISPYFYPPWAQDYLRGILEKYVKFEKIEKLINQSSPDLFIGAVNVLSGEFKVFKNTKVSVEAILASAAEPTILRAVEIGKTAYWDGMFSHNPPVRDFVEGDDASVKPDEIWIIHINPDTIENVPKSVGKIRDRRNALSGNLSLHQELDFLKTCNNWVKAGYLPGSKFKHVEVKFISMLHELDKESKLDRNSQFIHHMMAYGEEQAQKFLADLV